VFERLVANTNISAFQRPYGCEKNLKGYGFINFYPIKNLQSAGFLVDDSLLFKIEVTDVNKV